MNLKKLLVAGSSVGLFLTATASQAAIDVTAATTTITTDGTAAITAVGGAIIDGVSGDDQEEQGAGDQEDEQSDN